MSPWLAPLSAIGSDDVTPAACVGTTCRSRVGEPVQGSSWDMLGGMDPPTPRSGSTEIVFGPESGEVGAALGALCALSLAVGIELRDGSCFDAVLSDVIHDHLAVRGWDESAAGHTDDLTLLPLSSVARVTVS